MDYVTMLKINLLCINSVFFVPSGSQSMLYTSTERLNCTIIYFDIWFPILIFRVFQNLLMILYIPKIQTDFLRNCKPNFFHRVTNRKLSPSNAAFNYETPFFGCVKNQIDWNCPENWTIGFTSKIKLVFLHKMKIDFFKKDNNQNKLRL